MTTPAPMALKRPVARLRKPTQTHTALKVHSLTADQMGATLTVVGVWAGRFPTVADACAFAERIGAVE